MIEDRLVGIKSREIYEAPAALALITAHRDLESLTLERAVAREKRPSGVDLGRPRLRGPLVLAAARGDRCVRGHDRRSRDG